MKIRSGGLLIRLGIWMLGLHLFGISGLGQETGGQVPTAPDETANSKTDENSYSLLGTVVNSVTGEPVRRAVVQVSGQNGNMALTDYGGHFSLEGLTGGDVLLTATKPGFYEEQASHAAPVRVGTDAAAVVLKLTPWGVISGSVTTKDEQPLEGLQVHILAKQNVGGRLVWVEQPNQGRTNEEGEFRIPGLKAGAYYVSVYQSARTTLSQKGVANAREQTFAKVFYPGVSDMSSATPIEIAPGEEEDANFALLAEPLYQIYGSLRGAANAVSRLVFARKAGDDTDFLQTVPTEGGKFLAKLPPGAYSVGGQTADGVEWTTMGAGVVIRADEADLQIPLSAAATIPVEILKEQTVEESERRAAVQGGVPGVSLQLVPLSPSQVGASPLRVNTGEFRNVPLGTYRLEITTTGSWWVKSAQRGSADLLSEDLAVVEGERPDPIEVTVHEGAGTVSGTVIPAGGSASVLVLLVQSHVDGNFVRAAKTMRGEFRFPGVPPGDYSILAFDEGDRLEYANPDVLDPYLSEGEQVSVPARGNVTVNLGITAVGR